MVQELFEDPHKSKTIQNGVNKVCDKAK